MKKIIITVTSTFLLLILCNYCNENPTQIKLSFSNNTKTDIIEKTIEVDRNKLKNFAEDDLTKLKVINNATQEEIVYQLIDLNQDGKNDKLLFQISIKAGEKKSVTIFQGNEVKNFNSRTKVYAKFVPERKDDFAWENDRIAFRMYGPALEASGEVSNGIDVWVKSTRNLVLDKWYKGEDYHTDHGEGLDYYKVGPSLGCGGSALLEKEELNKSKNFIKWNIIANGPVRTVFELTYAPRVYKGSKITEVKRISLDSGSNLNKIEVKYITDSDSITFKNIIGIVKHSGEDEGTVSFNKEKGIFTYWEPTNKEHGNTAIGIIVDTETIDKMEETPEQYLIILKETSKKTFTYYAGAGWSKSGDFNNPKEWIDYLENFNNEVKTSLM